MKPRVTFADPERLLITYMQAAFAPLAEKPATCSPEFPATALTGTTCHLQIELEVGAADDYPVTERAQVRFTLYAPPGQRTLAKRIASTAQALFYSHPGDADVAGTRMLVGRSDVVTDPDTENLMVWFLGAVDLKARPLAS